MDTWLSQLREDLEHLQRSNLLRRLEPAEPDGKYILRNSCRLINFGSNDYLALSNHPRLKEAAICSIQSFGTGSGASRLVCGHLPLHAQIESRFADFKKTEAALIFPTGYMANTAAITSLAGKGDLICCDKLSHASLLDAARASGGVVRVFPHRQTTKLARLLAAHHAAGGTSATRAPRRLIVTDSVFSMDGDCADLPLLCDLAKRYEAILIVDEAHGTGVLGQSGAGLCELQGVTDRVDVVICTASKALGGLGGVVTACQEIIDTLVNRARSFIYTTAVPAAQAATIGAALDVIRDEPWRRDRVLALAGQLHEAIKSMGLSSMQGQYTVTPIVPILVGSPQAALDLAAHLHRQGIFAPAIRPPTVAPGGSRVRISLRADLQDGDMDHVIDAVTSWKKAL